MKANEQASLDRNRNRNRRNRTPRHGTAPSASPKPGSERPDRHWNLDPSVQAGKAC